MPILAIIIGAIVDIANNPESPINLLTEVEQNEEFAKISIKIIELMKKE